MADEIAKPERAPGDPPQPDGPLSPEPHNPEPHDAKQSHDKSQDEPPTKRQKFWAFAFAATGFLTVYVLSAGPMAAIHNSAKFGPFQQAIEIVYAPVVLLAKSRIEPFASILKAYIEVFR